MKIYFAVTVGSLLIATLVGRAAECTNKFAIHLVTDQVSQDSILKGTARPEGLKLSAQPIISDSDLVSYDTNKHALSVRPAVVARVEEACKKRLQTPFVLLACGERVYVGIFSSPYSSFSAELPTITIGLWATNSATGNVTLTIDRAYPAPSSISPPDPRGDPRVATAIRQLFSGQKL